MSVKTPRLMWALGLFLVIGIFVLRLDEVGIWDPVELQRAEAARTGNAPTFGWLAHQSLALSLRLFGTSVVAGRLPFALWGLVGVLALFVLVAAFRPLRVAGWSALVLSTMPLYFVQSRTMLGDIVMMASGSSALAGLAIATFGVHLKRRWRLLSLAVGLLALLAGLLTRGVLIGIAIPSLSVGLIWTLLRAQKKGDPLSSAFGASALAVGVVALVEGLFVVPHGQASLLLGFQPTSGERHSFDAPIASVAHSMFPWSALMPFAFTTLLTPSDEAAEPAHDILGPLLLVVAFLAYAAHAFAQADALAFPAPYALAAIVAISLTRSEVPKTHWTALAITAGCFALLITRDYLRLPEKGFTPYALARIVAPESFRSRATMFAWVSAGLLSVGLVAVALLAIAKTRAAHHTHAGSILFMSATLAGLALRFGHYRELGHHLSPKGAFDTYAKMHKPNEPLGLFSIDPRAGRYAGGPQTLELKDAKDALAWLSRTDRTWLLLAGKDLPSLNALYREHTARNIPILDGRSSETLLASSVLTAEDRNDNPLDELVLTEPPPISHRLDARIGEAIEPLGWNVIDERGRTTGTAKRGHRLRIYYRVTGNVEGSLCSFIHVEHTPTRFSAEHRDTDWARYPMRYWRKGDVIVDEFALALPAHFRSGHYPLYAGLDMMPCLGDRRVPVTKGSQSDNRLHLGSLEVLP